MRYMDSLIIETIVNTLLLNLPVSDLAIWRQWASTLLLFSILSPMWRSLPRDGNRADSMSPWMHGLTHQRFCPGVVPQLPSKTIHDSVWHTTMPLPALNDNRMYLCVMKQRRRRQNYIRRSWVEEIPDNRGIIAWILICPIRKNKKVLMCTRTSGNQQRAKTSRSSLCRGLWNSVGICAQHM